MQGNDGLHTTVTWEVRGGGSIDSDGTFHAPAFDRDVDVTVVASVVTAGVPSAGTAVVHVPKPAFFVTPATADIRPARPSEAARSRSGTTSTTA